MLGNYVLTQRQAWVCRVAALFFVAAALVRVMAVAVPLAIGSGPAIEVRCGQGGCITADRPDRLLPESERAAVVGSPAAASTLANYVRQPSIRALLVGIDIAAAAPFVLLMLFVAKAVRRLGSREGDGLAGALPWLHHASLAALAAALAPPVTDSLRAMLLFPATPSGAIWYLAIDFGPFFMGLLLACAAFIVTWALAVGSRARADVAEFV